MLATTKDHHRCACDSTPNRARPASYMERVGAKKSKGGRPSKEPSGSRTVSVAQVAKQLGIPKQTASDQLKAGEAYAAATPEQKAAIDAGEVTPKQVVAAWSASARRSRLDRDGQGNRRSPPISTRR